MSSFIVREGRRGSNVLVRSRLSLGWLSAGRVAYAVAVLSCGWTGVVDCGGTRQRDDSLEVDHPLSANLCLPRLSPRISASSWARHS